MNRIIIKDLEKAIGTATVIEEGLYYRISCVCNFPEKGIHKLIVKCGNRQVSLGTCLLEQENFILEKKVSIRSLGKGELRIEVEQDKAHFYPIKKQEAFPYIAEISQKKLEFINGEMGIKIMPNQDPQDSDQSP